MIAFFVIMPLLRVRFALWFSLACAAPLSGGCAQRHVQLKFPDTTPGAEYDCLPSKGQVNCRPADVIDTSQAHKARTVYVILPRECQRQFNEITIHDSGSSEPHVRVRCSPLENPIQ